MAPNILFRSPKIPDWFEKIFSSELKALACTGSSLLVEVVNNISSVWDFWESGGCETEQIMTGP